MRATQGLGSKWSSALPKSLRFQSELKKCFFHQKRKGGDAVARRRDANRSVPAVSLSIVMTVTSMSRIFSQTWGTGQPKQSGIPPTPIFISWQFFGIFFASFLETRGTSRAYCSQPSGCFVGLPFDSLGRAPFSFGTMISLPAIITKFFVGPHNDTIIVASDNLSAAPASPYKQLRTSLVTCFSPVKKRPVQKTKNPILSDRFWVFSSILRTSV